jgi:hypothetical protein
VVEKNSVCLYGTEYLHSLQNHLFTPLFEFLLLGLERQVSCNKAPCWDDRYFSVNKAYEEGLIDKLVPGYSLNRFRKLRRDVLGDQPAFNSKVR